MLIRNDESITKEELSEHCRDELVDERTSGRQSDERNMNCKFQVRLQEDVEMAMQDRTGWSVAPHWEK